VSILKVDIFA